MSTDPWATIEEYFNKANGLEESTIQTLLESIESPEVRLRVSSLLKRRRFVEAFMSASADEISHGIVTPEEETEGPLSGTLIGKYRIVKEIARGGMGAVYLAERADGEYEGRAAIKLLRPELVRHELRRRFKHETKVLSGLKHPFIASLLDAGTTEKGVPYIAMEFVEGLPLDEFCKVHDFTVREILRLFQKVCDAVSYSHRNLIVHRDLKPSNILITAEGVPKLLDFGISKIISGEDAIGDFHTVTRLGAMTPDFAAPEQLRAEQVTTAADVYSLGVILYSLLTGHRPFESDGNQLEFVKAVCEREPVVPSSKALERTTSVDCPVLPNSEARSLRGDLDNVVLKALKKEPERRYSSVEQFSEDIERYIEGRPVIAQSDTFFYRTRKFISRNRVGVLAAFAVFAALTAGVSAVVWQSVVAAVERDRARVEKAKAERINSFLQDLLNFSNPSWISSNPERNRKATIAEAIDLASQRAEEELADEPEVLAGVQLTLGSTYLSQGRYDQAERHLRSSFNVYAKTLGTESPLTLRSNLAYADSLLLQGKYDEAERRFREVIPGLEMVSVGDKEQQKWLAAAKNDLGLLLNVTGRTREAEGIFLEALSSAKSLKGKDRSIIPIAMGNLGLAYRDRGNLTGALEVFEKASEEFLKLSQKRSFEYGILLNNISIVQKLIGRYELAEENSRESHRIMLDILGESHQYTAYPLIQLSDIYYRKGLLRESLKLAEEALQIQRVVLPVGHNDMSYAHLVIGKVKTAQGKLSEGEEFLVRSLKTRETTLKKPHYLKAEVFLALGENLEEQGRYTESFNLLTKAEAMFTLTVGKDHPTFKECSRALADLKKKTETRDLTSKK